MGSVGTVLCHLLLDLVEAVHEVVLHALHPGSSLGSVLSHELGELDILGDALLVALLTESDHGIQLLVHLGVDTGLCELVVLNSLGKLSVALVELLDLLLSSTSKAQDRGLEGG